MYKQGQFLTETIFEFKSSLVTIPSTGSFLDALISILKVKQTHRYINSLTPGFDVLCGLEESCIYFGAWPEHNYNRLIVSSCKQFKYDKIIPLLKKYFKTTEKVHITINSDELIKEKVERLWM